MASNRIAELVDAPDGERAILQGNVAFAVGCVRGGIHAVDGYPGTPSTEVIDKALRHVQDRLQVGWSVNEAQAVGVAFGSTMTGADAVVTMKIPGLFQAADVVATVSSFTAGRGALVLYIATDFVPSSTQYLVDPRYFLKSCSIPILEPRDHQEMHLAGPLAVELGRAYSTPVAVLASGLLCHSEGLVALCHRTAVARLEVGRDFARFMNLPEIARRNYDQIQSRRMPGLLSFAESTPHNRIEWHDRSLGVVVHGIAEAYLREVWEDLPVKPSILSLGMTYPLTGELLRRFARELSGPVVVLGDGLRFVQEELLGAGIAAEGKRPFDVVTEWSPEAVARRLGAVGRTGSRVTLSAPRRPPTICAGCPYRAFALVVERLRKKKKIVASFGDIGCNTLLHFLHAVDTCACMGAADSKRQGAVLADPGLAGRSISVIGDSTECHSGMDSTRNAIFRHVPGVKVVLDNAITAMTGGQPAPSSPVNLAGQPTRFDLVAALAGEGARVEVVDGFDLAAIEKTLRAALDAAAGGEFTVVVVRGACMQQLPAGRKQARFELVRDRCAKCDLCLVCPGLEKDDEGYPRFTPLCTGCGGEKAICVQRCHLDAIVPARSDAPEAPPPPVVPSLAEDVCASRSALDLPRTLRVAVRGVGGQGNLFVGKVLAELALLLGFDRIIKGETHGMAQLGGAVLSTFSCGDVHSPVPAPGSVDVLVALETAEVLRPGFLDLLRPGGTVVLNRLRIIPAGTAAEAYPSLEEIRTALRELRIVEFDGLERARAIGDAAGKTVNVIALGVLSTVQPFSAIAVESWQEAVRRVSPSTASQRANWAAFLQGRRSTRKAEAEA